MRVFKTIAVLGLLLAPGLAQAGRVRSECQAAIPNRDHTVAEWHLPRKGRGLVRSGELLVRDRRLCDPHARGSEFNNAFIFPKPMSPVRVRWNFL